MIFIIFLLFGLLIGSFLNVLVYRLRAAEELFWDRSKCPHCQHLIRWYDNIPVISFMLLKFRCRDCRRKISWQYPLVEIFTGLVFALIGQYFFDPADSRTWMTTAYYLIITGALITISVYDWLYLEIPGEVLWSGIALAVAYGLYSDWATWFNFGMQGDIWKTTVYPSVLAAFLAFLFFFSLSVISREKWMGMGDAYLAILLGLIIGWPKILLALFLAFFIGAVWGTGLVIMGKKKIKSQLPFAPFMVFGTLVALFFYAPIVDWYLSLFLFQ